MAARWDESFELLLFSTTTAIVTEAAAGGVDGFIVDWEHLGKAQRQDGADTQLNYDTVEDLRRVRGATDSRVICRLNGMGAHTEAELTLACEAGADELLLPMVRSAAEVEFALEALAGRAALGILIETVDATRIAPELAELPLSRVYVGLNDLAIERGDANIFSSVTDGTVEELRAAFGDLPFGFGGLTLPDGGDPIRCRLVIAEMARLGCDFAFLRRSYLRDVRPGSQSGAVAQIRRALRAARDRSPEQVGLDRDRLRSDVLAWAPSGQPSRLSSVSGW